MTLRDEFALAILPLIFNQKVRRDSTREERFRERAQLAYEMADMMIAVREDGSRAPTRKEERDAKGG